jgi:hypothetical protein
VNGDETYEDRSDDLRPGPRRLPGARPGADADLRAERPEPRHGRALRHWQRPVARFARPHHVHDDDDERCDAVLRLRRPPHRHGLIVSPLMARSSRPWFKGYVRDSLDLRIEARHVAESPSPVSPRGRAPCGGMVHGDRRGGRTQQGRDQAGIAGSVNARSCAPSEPSASRTRR